MQLLQTIDVLREVLECFESKNVEKVSVVIAGAEAFGIKSNGYTLSSEATDFSSPAFGCFKKVAEKYKLELRQIEGYWVLCKL